jgi:gluconolactonase
VDLAGGRVLRVEAGGRFEVAAAYDGQPNGLAVHPDGRLIVADRRHGLLALDPRSGAVDTFLAGPPGGAFLGLNDLCFARSGDLYFTDQGESGLHDPGGRLFRLGAGGEPEPLLARVPSPNGLALAPGEDVLYLAVTRANAVWRVPLRAAGGVGRVGLFVQLSGGVGPDGLALDADGGLAVAHYGLGTVWLLAPDGEPRYRVRSPAGPGTTNVAWDPDDPAQVYITEAAGGAILRARRPGP